MHCWAPRAVRRLQPLDSRLDSPLEFAHDMGRVRGNASREAAGSEKQDPELLEQLTMLQQTHDELLARVRFYEQERAEVRDRLERLLRRLPAA